MTQRELNDLIDKVNSGKATDEELGIYNHYLNHLTSGFEAWNVEELGSEDAVKSELQNRIELLRKPHQARKLRLWPLVVSRSALWKVAAAITAITLGIWLFYASGLLGGRHLEGSTATRDLSTNDIAPGRNTATITFDNGEAVALNNEELDISSATVEPLKEGSEASSETPQFLASRIARSKTVVLSTPRGGTYQVTLPDGTKVWLNADSKIEFPSQFIGRERKVLLSSGEAYFEVAKVYSNTHAVTSTARAEFSSVSLRGTGAISSNYERVPFIVESAGQRVEVLGTHFNINAYAEEGVTKTTLLEGSVRVSPLLSSRGMAKDLGATAPENTKTSSDRAMSRGPSELGMTMGGAISPGAILKPGQQSVLQGKTIKVQPVDIENEVAWKKGDFVFADEDFKTTMRKLARWYDLEIIYDESVPENIALAGWVSRNSNLSTVLKRIELASKLHFTIEGRRLTVRK